MPITLWASLAAGVLTALLTPVITRWASERGIVEKPNPRRVHRRLVPTGAGIAMVAGFWGAAALFVRPLGEWTGLLIGSLVIAGLGLWDDRFGLKPWQKFVGQLTAAFILVASGTRIDFVTNPFGGMVHLGWLAAPLTVLWIAALTNAVNFIDGLDGLTAGITAIAAVPLLLIAAQRGHESVVLLTLCLLGCALGFLLHNFHPARVFMGDAGSMFLGFMLGAISVEGALKGAATMTLSIPLVALGLPVFDAACAIIRRGWNRRPIYEADAGHVHHRLLQRGLSHRRAVVFLYIVSALLGAVALVLHRMPPEARTYMMVPVLAVMGVWAQRLRIFDDRPALDKSMEPWSPRRTEGTDPLSDSGWAARG